MNKAYKLLQEKQKLRKQQEQMASKLPLIKNPFGGRTKVRDTDKFTSAELKQYEDLIEKEWELNEDIASEASKLKKGDKVVYLDIDDNNLKEAVVKSQGVYKNDYNDTSSFVRIVGGGYSWNQSKDCIAKK